MSRPARRYREMLQTAPKTVPSDYLDPLRWAAHLQRNLGGPCQPLPIALPIDRKR